MGTQLILTVGTNALPVWVAWYHLKDILEPPITVRFVYTSDTETQKNSLVSYCAGAGSGRHIQTSPGALGTVRGDIRREILTDLKDYLHVHYTGGTKVMSVETISTIESGLPEDILMDTTYLDPRGKIGPRITSRSKVLVEDARLGINLVLGALPTSTVLSSCLPIHPRRWNQQRVKHICGVRAKYTLRILTPIQLMGHALLEGKHTILVTCLSTVRMRRLRKL